jgi:hypothetical protein
MNNTRDVPQMLADVHGVLQLLLIEHPQVDTANAASIRKKGWAA